MRNYLSVFSLFVSRSFGKITALLTALTAGEIGLFLYYLYSDNAIQNEYISEGGADYLLGIEKLIEDNIPLCLLLIAGFIGVTAVLCLNGCEFSEKQGYTLRRLAISEKKVMLCQSAYGMAVYGIFIILHAIIFYAFSLIYVSFAAGHENAFTGIVTEQTVFLAFYRSNIMHAFMPLEDALKIVSNLVMISALGLSTASFSYLMRRKKFPLSAVLLIPVILINFASDWTEMTYDLIIIGVSLFVIGAQITRISTEEQAYDR